jgi:hypothetical protein
MSKKLLLPLLFPLLLSSLLLVGMDAQAGTISGGVPDSEIIARDLRDGASGVHFIDVDSQISGDGVITSWSIWAQSTGPASWGSPQNFDPRQVGLIIFRDNGSGYTVVGKSPLETIPSGAAAWDRKYTFSAHIPVRQGDRLGFFYPFQGSDIGGPYTNPGGVISFQGADTAHGGHNWRRHEPWGSAQATELDPGDSVAYAWFNTGYEVEGTRRIMSINVHGVANATSAPNILLLLE